MDTTVNMSTDLNTTAVNMTKEELENEYLQSKNQIINLMKKCEDYEQQLYETKRQLAHSKVMEQELSTEIESLQFLENSNTDRFAKKIAALEEEIIQLKVANNEIVQKFEDELKEKDAELQKSLTVKSKNEDEEANDKDKDVLIGKLNNEIYELKDRIEDILYQKEEFQLKNEDLLRENTTFENRLTELSSDLEEMREFLGIKKEELEASNERFHNLQDELMIKQMELDKLKYVPQDKAQKGNSLFAEVEDNRQKLRKYIQTMNKKFSEMKASYNRKNMELQQLHSAYASLKTAMDQQDNFGDDQARLIETYETCNEQLKENISALQKELTLRKEATEKLLNGKQMRTEALIEITRKEVMNLRTELTNRQFSKIHSEKRLFDTRQEVRKWRLEALSLGSENLILKQTVEDLKLRKSTLADSPTEPNTKTKSQNEGAPKKAVEVKKIIEEKPQIQNLVFDENKFKNSTLTSKYEDPKFWKTRTLTVLDTTLLDKSHSDTEPTHFGDNDFEEFDSDLTLKKPLPVYNLEDEMFKLNIGDREDKENVSKNILKENYGDNLKVDEKKKKVCFTQETVENTKPAPRRGKLLVPKYSANIADMMKKL